MRIEAMQHFDRITRNPAQMNGKPCVRGMRLTVRRVVEAVALYPNRDDLFRNYPELEPEDIQQALAFAAANLEDSAAARPGARCPPARAGQRGYCAPKSPVLPY
jgi:uncharacterized protein (DUF433 family)